MIYTSCASCGGMVAQKRGPSHVYRYCSAACCHAGKRGGALKPVVYAACSECAAKFRVFPSRLGVEKYCSPACSKAGASKAYSESAKKQWAAPGARDAQKERSRRSWKNPEHRDRHLAAVRTPEYQKLRSAVARRIWANEGLRDRMRQAVLGPVFKAAMKKRGPTRPIVWVKYRDVKMRSTWETTFAARLDALGCAWRYEPQQFDLGDGRAYTPDFWVRSPLGDAYVEVHRFESVKPGDEKKIAKIHFARGVLPLPLVLIGDSDIARIRRDLVHTRENAIEDGDKPPKLKP